MKKVWLFIGRLNPPHLGHISVINSSLKNEDITVILLGSSNVSDSKNPLSYEDRKDMLSSYFFDYINNNKLLIDHIPDYPSDKNWVIQIWKKLNNLLWNIEFELTIYAWDMWSDYAISAIKDYQDQLNIKKISYTEISRDKLIIDYSWEKHYLSSTLLRETLIAWKDDFSRLIMWDIMYKKYTELSSK